MYFGDKMEDFIQTLGSPYKTMQVYNFNKLYLMASVNR